jgi:hypothetical protein
LKHRNRSFTGQNFNGQLVELDQSLSGATGDGHAGDRPQWVCIDTLDPLCPFFDLAY